MQHLLCLSLSLFLRGMSRVAFLPEKLGGAEERTRAHLPAHDVTPLVAHDRQVAPGVDPVLIRVPDHRLGGRTDDKGLVELGLGVNNDLPVVGSFQTVVSHHGAFFGEAFDVLCLTGKEAHGDEQREIGVLYARCLEHLVELGLHLLPDSIAVRLDNHTAAHRSNLCQVGFHHQVVVPLTVIVSALGQLF